MVIYENIDSANPLYLIIGEVDTDKNKEVLRNARNLGMGLKMRLRQ